MVDGNPYICSLLTMADRDPCNTEKKNTRVLKFQKMNLVNEASFEEMGLLGVSWATERSLVMLGSFRVGFMSQNKSHSFGWT